jgi:LysR family transcriptional regulator, nitrogen assimilation regulatory protein
MIELVKLELFVQVADLGSLSKAASLLGASPSAVSRQISAVESQCGGPLFLRTGRGLVLTTLGERILPQARRLLLDAEALNVDIQDAAKAPAGKVRLGMLQAAADPLVTLLLKRLSSEYPGIALHVIEGSSGLLEQWASLGQVDITLLVREKGGVHITDVPLATNPVQLMMAAVDPLATAASITFDEIAGLPLIVPGLPNRLRTTLAHTASQRGVQLNIAWEVDSLPLQKQLVAAGLGYAIASRGFVRPRHDSGLVSIPIVEPTLERTMVLAASTQRPLTQAARVTLDLLRAITREMAGESLWQDIATDTCAIGQKQ